LADQNKPLNFARRALISIKNNNICKEFPVEPAPMKAGELTSWFKSFCFKR